MLRWIVLNVRVKASSTVALAVNRPFAMYAQPLVQTKRQGILKKRIVLESVTNVSMAVRESSLISPRQQNLSNPASPFILPREQKHLQLQRKHP